MTCACVAVIAMLAGGCGRISFDVNEADAQMDAPLPSGLGSFGGSGRDLGRSIATLPGGSVAITGGISGDVVVGETMLPSADAEDIALIVLDRSGGVRWARSFGSENGEHAYGVGADDDGTIYITGFMRGIVDFGGGPITPQSTDAFVASFTPDGAHRWSRRYGGAATDTQYGSDRGEFVAARGGRVFVGGNCRGVIDLGGGPVCGINAGFDSFLMGIDRDSGFLWARAVGGGTFTETRGGTADATRVVWLGHYEGTPDLGSGSPSIPATPVRGIQDGFIVVVDHFGTLQWAKDFGGTDYDYPLGASIDDAGNIYVTGYFASPTITIAGRTLSGVGGEAFVASFDSAGNDRWAYAFGSSGCDAFHKTRALASGEIIVVGRFSGTVDFGTGPLTATAGTDGVVVALDRNGTVLWARALGRPEAAAFGVGGSADALFVTGFANSTQTGCVGSGVLTASQWFIERS